MTTGRDIRELDGQTVERIAAGEVVERPASAVKELVENALDADAGRVEVTVEDGGIEGVRVADDGVGMTREGVRRAVREHTTSKIDDVEDLEAGVATLGFRGEALHAIGAVSRMTVTTRPRDGEAATELRVEGGEVTDVGPAGRAPGTTVAVEDLFYNVPARRKYLERPSTEFAHVNRVVSAYALAKPDVAVSLTHDGTETFATAGQGDRREAVMAVYGRAVARAMIDVAAGTDALPDGPLDGVAGLVSHPETNRAGREYCSTFVNGRYVRSSAVREAIVSAYGTQLAPDRFPFAVLDLSLDPGAVDVNVHPRKLEVRFADEAGMRAQVEAAVEDALLEAGLIRSSAPRGQSAPDQTEIAPEREGAQGASNEPVEGPVSERAAGSPADAESTAEPAPSSHADTHEGIDDGQVADDSSHEGNSRAAASADPAPASSASEAESVEPDRKFGGDHAQDRLGDAPDPTFESLPSLTVLGQLDDTYVVAEAEGGLVLVDQHAADERVNYERLRERVREDATSQALATPVELSLTPTEATVLEDRRAALERLGFRVERTGDRAVAVSAVPGLLADAAGPDVVRDVLGSFARGEGAAADTVEAATDALLGDLACYPSVTGNESLTEGSIRDLLAALDACENPWACPHGRPTVVEVDAEEIAARFERDYPGHGGRRD